MLEILFKIKKGNLKKFKNCKKNLEKNAMKKKIKTDEKGKTNKNATKNK